MGAVEGMYTIWVSSGDEAVLGLLLTIISPVDRSALPPEPNSFVASFGDVFRSGEVRPETFIGKRANSSNCCRD